MTGTTPRDDAKCCSNDVEQWMTFALRFTHRGRSPSVKR